MMLNRHLGDTDLQSAFSLGFTEDVHDHEKVDILKLFLLFSGAASVDRQPRAATIG